MLPNRPVGISKRTQLTSYTELGSGVVHHAENGLYTDNVNTIDIKNASITSEKIADGAITSSKIASGVLNINTSNISDGSITSSKIASNAVTTNAIVDGSITSAKIADGTISTIDIANNAITNAKIADGSITNAKIADNAITTSKIANSAVTSANLDNNLSFGNATLSGNLNLYQINASSSTDLLDDANLADNYYNPGVGINFKMTNNGIETILGNTKMIIDSVDPDTDTVIPAFVVNSLDASNNENTMMYVSNDGLLSVANLGLVLSNTPSLANAIYYPQQWYLSAIGAQKAWRDWGVSGKGITICVLDEFCDTTHDDLYLNVTRNFAANPINDYVIPPSNKRNHGTNVTGLINGQGSYIIGVAPDADINFYNISDDNGVYGFAKDALVYDASNNEFADIYSNSWGGATQLLGPSNAFSSIDKTDVTNAIIKGIKNGRNGKGSIYIFAAGNDGAITVPSNIDLSNNLFGILPFQFQGGNANWDGSIVNSIYTITVGSRSDNLNITYYSSPGSCVLCSGPGGHIPITVYSINNGLINDSKTYSYEENSTIDIVTTNPTINSGFPIINTFSGTSATTPMVAGCIAMLLEAYPEFTWRDIKELISMSCYINDELSYIRNASGRYYNTKSGYGCINIDKLLSTSYDYTVLPNQLYVDVSMNNSDAGVIQETPGGKIVTITVKAYDSGNYLIKDMSSNQIVDISSNIIVEMIMLHLNMGLAKDLSGNPVVNQNEPVYEISINLISPSGTKIPCIVGTNLWIGANLVNRPVDNSYNLYNNYDLLHEGFRGENAIGNWIIEFIDQIPNGYTTHLISLGMTIYCYDGNNRLSTINAIVASGNNRKVVSKSKLGKRGTITTIQSLPNYSNSTLSINSTTTNNIVNISKAKNTNIIMGTTATTNLISDITNTSFNTQSLKIISPTQQIPITNKGNVDYYPYSINKSFTVLNTPAGNIKFNINMNTYIYLDKTMAGGYRATCILDSFTIDTPGTVLQPINYNGKKYKLAISGGLFSQTTRDGFSNMYYNYPTNSKTITGYTQTTVPQYPPAYSGALSAIPCTPTIFVFETIGKSANLNSGGSLSNQQQGIQGAKLASSTAKQIFTTNTIVDGSNAENKAKHSYQFYFRLTWINEDDSVSNNANIKSFYNDPLSASSVILLYPNSNSDIKISDTLTLSWSFPSK